MTLHFPVIDRSYFTVTSGTATNAELDAIAQLFNDYNNNKTYAMSIQSMGGSFQWEHFVNPDPAFIADSFNVQASRACTGSGGNQWVGPYIAALQRYLTPGSALPRITMYVDAREAAQQVVKTCCGFTGQSFTYNQAVGGTNFLYDRADMTSFSGTFNVTGTVDYAMYNVFCCHSPPVDMTPEWVSGSSYTMGDVVKVTTGTGVAFYVALHNLVADIIPPGSDLGVNWNGVTETCTSTMVDQCQKVSDTDQCGDAP